MPTPDASQFTQFKRYASISGDALGSVGSKISPFNTSYTLPILSASSQALFLPSANKETKFPSSPPYYNPLTLNTPVTKPIVPRGEYQLFTFTPTQSGWYRIIVDGFGEPGPDGNDMDLAVGNGNAQIDIPAIVDYDINDDYDTPPTTPIKVLSFSGRGSDQITDYFVAGQTYQVLVIGYSGDGGGTYTITVRDNKLTEGVDNSLVSNLYYTGSYQLYRFVAPRSFSYEFSLNYQNDEVGDNRLDLFISQANTSLDIQGCIDYLIEETPLPPSVRANSYGAGPKTVYSPLTEGSTYEVLVYQYNTYAVFNTYELAVFED